MDRDKQVMERNIELSAEFSRYLFEHPEVDEKIPKGAEIIQLPESHEELKEFNLGLGRKAETEGGMVIYISIKHLRPRALSRIEEIGIDAVL